MSGNRAGGGRLTLDAPFGQGILYFTTLSLTCGESGGSFLPIGGETTLILFNFLYCSTKSSKVCWDDMLIRVEVLAKGVPPPFGSSLIYRNNRWSIWRRKYG